MLEFEHSLFKLLLLVAVVSAKPPGRKWLPLVFALGFALAFLPPVISINFPWDWVLGLTIPLLFWQNGRRIIAAEWGGKWKDILIWLGAALLFSMVFWLFRELELTGAIIFGLVAASMIWSVGERDTSTSIVSLIGPFTLIFLLAEVEPLIQNPTGYMGGIFSGISVGVMAALAGILLSRRFDPNAQSWIALGQVYMAYGFALLAGVSAVAASLAAVIVYVTLGLYLDFWPGKRVTPTPINSWGGFIYILVLFVFLGWQAHYPPSSLILLEVLVGFVVSLLIAWIGQLLKLEAFSQETPLWRIGLRVALLLFPALLIWPRDTLQQPSLLAYAFGIAILNLLIARLTLTYFFEKIEELYT
jgi:hypothetical protein